MREIKFRGKRIDGQGWIYGWLRQSGNQDIQKSNGQYIRTEKYYQIQDDKYNSQFIVEDTIGQYTGLKDKNGKEIYEGDIVKSILILRDGTAFKTNIDVVEWNEIDCSFMLGKGLRHFNEHLILEVTGNIYDNPKMLEEEIC